MSSVKDDIKDQWADAWLNPIANGLNTMSQRRLSSIQKYASGLEAVKVIAIAKGIHLLLLEDDKGNQIIAASKNPFQVIC